MSDIDAMIAEAFPQAEAQPQADAQIETTIETKEEPVAETPEAEDDNSDEVVFPKKAINALSRKDKQLGKYKANLEAERSARQALEQRIAEYEAKKPTQDQNTDGRPTEADSQTYAEYVEKLTEWKLEQKLKEREGKQEQANNAQQEEAFWKQRLNDVQKQSDEFAKEYPDIKGLADEYDTVVKELPYPIKQALLKAENPPLAFYNLAKSGVIEELGDMSLEDARVEIKLALKQQPKKPQSQTPRPLAPARGSVAGVKGLDKMSPEELVKMFT